MTPRDDLFTATTGAVERLEELPPFLRDDPDVKAVMYAYAKAAELRSARLEWLRQQFLPHLADEDGLVMWEAIFRLATDRTVPVEDRRAVVLAYFRAIGQASGRAEWEAAVTRIVGTGWSYEEHDPGSGEAPLYNTILIDLPFPPSSGTYAIAEALIRNITEAHIDLQVQFSGGFLLDNSQLDQEGLGGGGGIVEPSFYADSIPDLAGWYRPESLEGTADGATVAQWLDSSNRARHAVQATAGARPTYRLNRINGKAALEFDGNSDFLQAPTSVSTGATVFTVVRFRAPSAFAGVLSLHSGNAAADWTSPANIVALNANGDSTAWQTYYNNANIALDARGSLTRWTLVTSRWPDSGGPTEIFLDGVAEGTAANGPGAALAATQAIFGARRDANGATSNFGAIDLAESLIYDRALTPAERKAVEDDLLAKYAITPVPPPPIPESGLAAWYDASQITGVSNGGTVASWPDSSGNGRTLTAQGANAATNLTYVTSGLNGQPVVRSAPTGSQNFRWTGADLGGTGGHSFFCVFGGNVTNHGGGSGRLLSAANAPASDVGANGYTVYVGTPGTASDVSLFNGGTTAVPIQPSGAGAALWSGTYNNAIPVWNVGRNGATATPSGSGASLAGIDSLALFANTQNGELGDGDIAEVILYNRALSTAERQQVEQYLTLKYALIPPGPSTWYRADTLGLADGALVSSWADSSANGRNATQGTAANRPVYVASGIGGRPSVRFDGANDFLRAAAFTHSAEWSVFAVCRDAGSSYPASVVDSDPGGAGTRQALYLRYGGSQGVESIGFDTAGASYTDGSPTFTANSALVASAVRGASTIEVRTNGASNGSSAVVNPGAALSQVLDLGRRAIGANYFNGDIAEVILYPRALTTAERQQAERYLGAKYGITVA